MNSTEQSQLAHMVIPGDIHVKYARKDQHYEILG